LDGRRLFWWVLFGVLAELCGIYGRIGLFGLAVASIYIVLWLIRHKVKAKLPDDPRPVAMFVGMVVTEVVYVLLLITEVI
jgi:hypothetical protein